MMRRVQTIGAVVLALLPAAAPALELSGRIGARYEQSELQTPESNGRREDWLVEGSLSGAGSVFGPGIVDWTADVDYGRWRQTYFDAGGSSAGIRRADLAYRAYAGVFRRPGSRLGLDLRFDRLRSDDLNVQYSPSTLTTSSSVGLHYADLLRPTVSVTLNRLETETPLPVSGLAHRDVDSLESVVKHTAGGVPYNIYYRGDRSRGTFDMDNYDRHELTFQSRAELGSHTTGYMDERYIQRNPMRTTGGVNPFVMSNALFAGVDWVDGPTASRTQYAYLRALSTDPSLPTAERTLNTLTERIEYTPSRELRYSGVVAASVDFDRRDGLENRAASQTASFLVRRQWFPSVSEISVEAGPIAGVVEPFVGEVRPGYGGVLNAVATLMPPEALTRARVGYNATFRRDLDATEGWTLDHGGFVDVEKFLRADLSLRGGASFSAAQSSSAAFGRHAERNALLTAGLRWRRLTATFEGGLRSGFAGLSTTRIPAGEALFLPYDSHTRYVTGSLWIPLGSTLGLSGTARHSEAISPDRPVLTDRALLGAATWSIGGLAISIEDRYSLRSEASRTVTENVIFIRAVRAFGTRF